MEEVRDPKSAVNFSEETQTGTSGGEQRDREATSDATLSDLEESQKISSGAGTATANNDTGRAPVAPSPDGAFDEAQGGSADGRDSGGPM